MISLPNDEFGDFQTPVGLARQVFEVLQGGTYKRVLEPTCGVGNFLYVARELLPSAELRGVEIQPDLAQAAAKVAQVDLGDAMNYDFAGLKWGVEGKLLVVGNPPWVTNAALTTMSSDNKPALRNIRQLKGIDAITGAANFDIAEAIILKLMDQLGRQAPTIALLCKTQVARNVLAYSEQFRLPVAESRIYEIDAKRWFNAGVDACLFVLEMEPGATNYTADVYADLADRAPRKTIGVVDGLLVSNVEAYEHTKAADGVSPIEWRQGIKHDATAAMELVEDGGPHRKDGRAVDVEPEYLFPLLKCTDVARGRTTRITKWMVVPQRHTGDDTSVLARVAPKLHSYLMENSTLLDGRKSSIYRNRARFCIFGVGPYSFAPYKVAISGMHKEPLFRLVTPLGDRPVVFDDVTYFSSFEHAADAAVVTAILNEEPAQALVGSISFTDSKRPITKKLLQRLDVAVLADLSTEKTLLLRARDLALVAGLNLAEQDILESINRARGGFKVSSPQGELALF